MANIFRIPDKEKNYQAFMLYAISMIWSVTIALIVSAGFYYFPLIWKRWLGLVILSLTMALLVQFINSRFKTYAASWVFIIYLWLLITLPCLSAGGIEAPGVMSQISVILSAGFLLGWRGGLLFGILSVFTDLGFAIMEMNGILPEMKVHHTPITRWIGAIIPFGTIIALQYYATNHLRASLETMKKEITRREKAEQLKDKALKDMGERVKELRTLFHVSRFLQKEELDIEQIYQNIVNTLPAGWQHPEITTARLWVNEKIYKTENYKASEFSQTAQIKTSKGSVIGLEVNYQKAMPKMDEGPFLNEERNLINSLVEILKTDLERREHRIELDDYKYAIDLSSIVSISNVDGIFTYVNDNFIKISKYSEAELIGNNYDLLYSGYHQPSYFEELSAVLEKGEYFRGEFCNKAKDGSIYWVDSTIIPFLNKEGKVYQYLSLNQDITQKKLAEEKIRKGDLLLRKITSQVPCTTYMFEVMEDGSYKVLFMNRGNEKYDLELDHEILSQHPERLIESVHEEDKIKFAEAIKKAFLNEENIDIQYRVSRNDITRWRWMQATPERNEEGKHIWYGVSSDITPMVEHIGSVEQIIFDLSHVIRRPIANLLGITYLLNEHKFDEEELKDIYKNLSATTTEMDSFITELNSVYQGLRKQNAFKIETSALVDKRKSLFN